MANERRSVSLCAATRAFLDELGDIGRLGLERPRSAVHYDAMCALCPSAQASQVKSSDHHVHVGATPIEPIPFTVGFAAGGDSADEYDARVRCDIDAALDVLQTALHTVRPHTKDCDQKQQPSRPLTMNANKIKRKKKEKVSTSRRQKDELLYLRAKVTQLERELRELRSEKPQREPKTPPPAQDAPQSSTLAARRPALLDRKAMWKLASQRQLKEKRRAELENVQLKQELEEQMRFTKAIERMLRKQPTW
ncbi:hypothetical protein FI667_g11907, partial [Globisporangium splendens]